MRREHYINNSLLVHFPLDSENGLTDVVSGNSLSLTGNGSLVWNSNRQMYLLSLSSTLHQYVAYMDTQFSSSAQAFPTNDFTSIITLYKNSSTGYCSNFGIRSTNEGNPGNVSFGSGYNNTFGINNYPSNTIMKLACAHDVSGTNKRYIYQQHSLYASTSDMYSQYTPSNIIFTNPLKIILGYSLLSNVANIYIKDYYLFNRVLSASEIYKIQGYE